MIGERRGLAICTLCPVVCWTKVQLNQVPWPDEVVEEEKSGDWSTGSSRQKDLHALEKFDGEF